MKNKAIIPLVAGLAVGVFAIKMTYNFMKNAKANTVSGEQTSVIRTKADVPMAAEITDKMIEVVRAPKGLIPVGSFAKPEEVLGRVSSMLIPKGMPVLANMLAPKGTKAGMESRIPEGFRAVAVKIDESSGVAFLVKPGSRVDVVAVMAIKIDNVNETISKTVLENVEVAAVGQELGEKGDKAALNTKSVTLLVKPEDVPKLHLASQKGKILLAMRNQTDMSSRQVAGTTEKNLLGMEDRADKAEPKKGLFSKLMQKKAEDAKPSPKPVQQPVVVVPLAPVWTVEVVQGDKVSEVKFESKNAAQRVSEPGKGKAAGRAPGGAVLPVHVPVRSDGTRGAEPQNQGPEQESSKSESSDTEQGG